MVFCIVLCARCVWRWSWLVCSSLSALQNSEQLHGSFLQLLVLLQNRSGAVCSSGTRDMPRPPVSPHLPKRSSWCQGSAQAPAPHYTHDQTTPCGMATCPTVLTSSKPALSAQSPNRIRSTAKIDLLHFKILYEHLFSCCGVFFPVNKRKALLPSSN